MLNKVLVTAFVVIVFCAVAGAGALGVLLVLGGRS